MQPDDFIVNIKANGSKTDVYDLDQIYIDYKKISNNLRAKDCGLFSLNVLCILCRNIDKIPSWRDNVDVKELLTLSIDCLRETRVLDGPERVKSLACIYHIHKYAVKQSKPSPPELIIKLVYMAFEPDVGNLLNEHFKTYWHIVADHILYLEKLKAKASLTKLLPKLTEIVLKTVKVYDTVQFCMNILLFLVKKMYFLFNEKAASELDKLYGEIFTNMLEKNDLKGFRRLKEKDLLDLYTKFIDCLYVIAENSSRIGFEGLAMETAVRTCTNFIGHNRNLQSILYTYHSNICSILKPMPNMAHVETVFNNLLINLEETNNMDEKIMLLTYPNINQFLKLFIERFIKIIDLSVHDICLKLICYLTKQLESSEQVLKCEGCKAKTGLHDALRLSFLAKNLMTQAIETKFDMSQVLATHVDLVHEQYDILQKLGVLSCNNYVKYFRKLQTDVHNTAILLNKAQYYEFSIKLFDLYIKKELTHFKSEEELKNISRALYNKSICEMDYKLYEIALLDAYLSLIFSREEALKSEKYMSLVVDIKAKALKAEHPEEFQLISVLDASNISKDKCLYGNLKPFLLDVKFGLLLKHEYDMYLKLWPSVVAIAGVWRALARLTGEELSSADSEETADVTRTLYEVLLGTPNAVRIMHSEHYSRVITQLLERYKEEQTGDARAVHATLLMLKTECELHEASEKYGWKQVIANSDPDQIAAVRTVQQEHRAARHAVEAVRIWRQLARDLSTVSPWVASGSLAVAQTCVQQLVQLNRAPHALQLAHACCQLAQYLNDKEAYITNASVILHHVEDSSAVVDEMLQRAARWCRELSPDPASVDVAVVFLCSAAMHYSGRGAAGVAARVLRLAQARVLAACTRYPEGNFDLSVGAVLEAQTRLCASADSAPTLLSAVSNMQRHYLAASHHSGAGAWCSRRRRALRVRSAAVRSGAEAARAARWLAMCRRARGAAAAALPAAPALPHAQLFATITDAHHRHLAMVRIENHLKYILGIQPSSDTLTYKPEEQEKRVVPNARQEVEVMLEKCDFRGASSPRGWYTSVPNFEMPSWFSHEISCVCAACQIPFCYILACVTFGLEAAVYFRGGERRTAEDYFNGALAMCSRFEQKLKESSEFEDYIATYDQKFLRRQLMEVHLEIMLEFAFMELAEGRYEECDAHVVRIHEVMQADVDPYLKNEIMNLLTACARVRHVTTTPTELEIEMESLKLTDEEPKTPVNKPANPPLMTRLMVKQEEIMKRRKVIKLNLDEGTDEVEPEPKPQFKIPVPLISKPILENATPRAILVTRPTLDLNEDTPEKWFSQSSSLETPNKNDVTPQKSSSRSRAKAGALRSLRRATSPGALPRDTRRSKRVQ
ncbi:uncharacterized protein LOC115450762 [Manduca sexta]|uniref:uncharacterized protein LOC115450762 n=1 Tax=Manduca sexta TaxID=7130 RepID=UPI00188EE15A|nr:uncharacterized protein LOC115450762 [Manduca sexta]